MLNERNGVSVLGREICGIGGTINPKLDMAGLLAIGRITLTGLELGFLLHVAVSVI